MTPALRIVAADPYGPSATPQRLELPQDMDPATEQKLLEAIERSREVSIRVDERLKAQGDTMAAMRASHERAMGDLTGRVAALEKARETGAHEQIVMLRGESLKLKWWLFGLLGAAALSGIGWLVSRAFGG